METCRRHLPEGHRRRAGHPGRDAGPARVRQRGAVAAVCLQAPVGPFPYLPGQSGYNKRLRKLAATMGWLVRIMAIDTSLWADDVWVIDSTPVECGRSRDTVLRSDLAGWAISPSCRQQAG